MNLKQARLNAFARGTSIIGIRITASLAVLVISACLCPVLAAQEPAQNQAPSRFRFSFVERIRQESSDNVTSLNDSASDSSAYLRCRTSVGVLWQASPNLEFALKLTNENRYYIAPKSDVKLKKNYDINEVFFDQLVLRWKNPADLPLTLTLGRQDIQFGEGFIIFDGGPLDGSRSAYFNAVRLDWAAGAKTTLSAFYLDQPRTDKFLPASTMSASPWSSRRRKHSESTPGAPSRSSIGKLTSSGRISAGPSCPSGRCLLRVSRISAEDFNTR